MTIVLVIASGAIGPTRLDPAVGGIEVPSHSMGQDLVTEGDGLGGVGTASE